MTVQHCLKTLVVDTKVDVSRETLGPYLDSRRRYLATQRRITRSHVRTTNSQFIGVPFLTSRAARLPSTSARWRVWSPWPGRMERTFDAVKISPCFTSSTTNKERRNTRLASSLALKPKYTSPKTFSAVRIAST